MCKSLEIIAKITQTINTNFRMPWGHWTHGRIDSEGHSLWATLKKIQFIFKNVFFGSQQNWECTKISYISTAPTHA